MAVALVLLYIGSLCVEGWLVGFTLAFHRTIDAVLNSDQHLPTELSTLSDNA